MSADPRSPDFNPLDLLPTADLSEYPYSLFTQKAEGIPSFMEFLERRGYYDRSLFPEVAWHQLVLVSEYLTYQAVANSLLQRQQQLAAQTTAQAAESQENDTRLSRMSLEDLAVTIAMSEQQTAILRAEADRRAAESKQTA